MSDYFPWGANNRYVEFGDFTFSLSSECSEEVTEHTVQAYAHEFYDSRRTLIKEICFLWEFPENTGEADVVYTVTVEYEGEIFTKQITMLGSINSPDYQHLQISVETLMFTPPYISPSFPYQRVTILWRTDGKFVTDGATVSPAFVYGNNEAHIRWGAPWTGTSQTNVDYFICRIEGIKRYGLTVPVNRTLQDITYTFTVESKDETASAYFVSPATPYTITHALEILRYLAKLPSQYAELEEKPTINDALFVLRVLAKLETM
jgi:hypothetical protein